MPTPIEMLEARIAQGREYRAMPTVDIAENYTVQGYCTTFNDPYLLYRTEYGEVWEDVDPHAFDDCDMSDVILQYDHMGHVYARTRNGTLSIAPDDHGLKITAYLGGTEIGRQLYEEIKGEYTDRMSFGFLVGEDSRTVEENHDTGYVIIRRTIRKVSKTFDASAVSLPANNNTDISARSFGDGVIAEARKELRKRALDKLNLLLFLED